MNRLSFAVGRAVALVGLSGSGKSTLMDIIARINLPQGGIVLCDDQDINNFSTRSFYSNIGYASQETVIFHDTIFANLAFYDDTVSEEQVREALYLAAADEFVAEMDDGLNTVLGERGLSVSGGQRQRINLARVFMKKPNIILLDEATNALDLATESLVYNRLLEMKENRIIIVAAHRLSAIQNFDHIVVIHQGEVAEEGTHEKLLAKRQLYSSLYALQQYNG